MAGDRGESGAKPEEQLKLGPARPAAAAAAAGVLTGDRLRTVHLSLLVNE